MSLLLVASVPCWSAIDILMRCLAMRMSAALLVRIAMKIHSRKSAMMLAQAVGRRGAKNEGERDRRSDHESGVKREQTDRRAKSQSLSQTIHAEIGPPRTP